MYQANRKQKYLKAAISKLNPFVLPKVPKKKAKTNTR